MNLSTMMRLMVEHVAHRNQHLLLMLLTFVVRVVKGSVQEIRRYTFKEGLHLVVFADSGGTQIGEVFK